MNTILYFVIFLLVLYILFQCNNKNKIPNNFDNSIRIMYRQSARWAAAAIQDESVIIQVLHANYAAGYLWALKDIVSTSEFKRITGQDFLEFENEIVKIQDSSTKRLIETCQSLMFAENPILYKAMYLRSPNN
jgi:hypothetical protein